MSAVLLFLFPWAWSAVVSPTCERLLGTVRAIPFRQVAPEPVGGVAGILREVGVNPDLRTLWIQTALVDYLRTSERIRAAIPVGGDPNPAAQFYDVVFIGAGPAELTAQLKLARRIGTSPKTLTIEADRTVSRTFAATRAFYLNSTDGSSTSNLRALPNRGLNLNKIPNSLIQTSDLQTSKYAEAGEFGDVVSLNRLALPAPILFGERVDSFGPTSAPLRARGYPASTIRLASGREVFANVVVQTTGLGAERSTASTAAGRELANAGWSRFVETGALPRYFSASRFFNFISSARQPYAPFVNKRVVVIGAGDYAKVIWEYLERTGPAGAYRRDTAELGRYAGGVWLAPNIDAQCASFVGSERTRYLRGIPGALQKGRIVGVPGVSQDIVANGDGLAVTYVTGKGEVKRVEADFVIDAIGFERRSLARFREARPLIADLPDTPRATIGTEIYPGAYLAGVAANAPVTPEELANVDDNRVSLYLNLVRVEALANQIDAAYGPSFGRFEALPEPDRPALGIGAPTSIELRLVNPNGRLQGLNYAKEFAETQIAGALAQFGLAEDFRAEVVIRAERSGDHVAFTLRSPRLSGSDFDADSTRRVAEWLTVSPAFLSVLEERVAAEGLTKFSWTIQRRRSRIQIQSRFKTMKTPGVEPPVVATLRVVGVTDVESLSFSPKKDVPEAPSPERIEDLRFRFLGRQNNRPPAVTDQFLRNARERALTRRREGEDLNERLDPKLLKETLARLYASERKMVGTAAQARRLREKFERIYLEAGLSVDDLPAGQRPGPRLRTGVFGSRLY